MKTTRKNTSLFLIVLVVILVVIGVAQYILASRATMDTQSPSSEGRDVSFDAQTTIVPTLTLTPQTIQVKVDFSQAKIVTEKVAAPNVFIALQLVADRKKFTVQATDLKFGKQIEKIGDRANSSEYNWVYRVNGKSSPIASDRYLLKLNDSVEWTYEKLKK